MWFCRFRLATPIEYTMSGLLTIAKNISAASLKGTLSIIVEKLGSTGTKTGFELCCPDISTTWLMYLEWWMSYYEAAQFVMLLSI